MFELKEPTSGKLKKAEDKAIKIGQKDLRAAALITLEHTLPNTALEMFDGELREIFYGPGSPGEKGRKQAKFDGMDMVQDRPALTATGQALATLNWGKEQTGCTLTIDQGTGGAADLILKDGTVKDTKVSLLEGGAVKVRMGVCARSARRARLLRRKQSPATGPRSSARSRTGILS